MGVVRAATMMPAAFEGDGPGHGCREEIQTETRGGPLGSRMFERWGSTACVCAAHQRHGPFLSQPIQGPFVFSQQLLVIVVVVESLTSSSTLGRDLISFLVPAGLNRRDAIMFAPSGRPT